MIAPLLFLVVFALLEMGRIFMVLHGLETSAREGCRVAILYGATEAEVTQRVNERLATFNIDGATVTTTPTPLSNVEQFAPITVKITVPYRDISLLRIFADWSDFDLGGSCTLPKETAKLSTQS